MGRRTLDAVYDLMNHAQSKYGDDAEIPTAAVRTFIELYIGADKVTISKYMQFLRKHRFMVEVKPGVWKFDHDKAAEMIL